MEKEEAPDEEDDVSIPSVFLDSEADEDIPSVFLDSEVDDYGGNVESTKKKAKEKDLIVRRKERFFKERNYEK